MDLLSQSSVDQKSSQLDQGLCSESLKVEILVSACWALIQRSRGKICFHDKSIIQIIGQIQFLAVGLTEVPCSLMTVSREPHSAAFGHLYFQSQHDTLNLSLAWELSYFTSTHTQKGGYCTRVKGIGDLFQHSAYHRDIAMCM